AVAQALQSNARPRPSRMTQAHITLNRRTAIKKIGARLIGTAVITQFDCGRSLAACARPMRIRRNINDQRFGQVAADSYRNAVDKLKSLRSSDARDWLNMADVHKNFCPHGNWYFLPWHRAYLLALEDVCAALLGE